MATFFGMTKLGSPEDWKGLAGEGKWRETRSAYELAYAWHGAPNGIPQGIAAALTQSGVPELSKLKLEVGFVEKPTFLDTPIGPSMTDIMGYARNGSGDPVIFAVEGKATETFGLPVRVWVRGDEATAELKAEARPSRARRLRYLADRLGLEVSNDSELYYQLLHRTVSGVMEAALHGSACAVLIVHSFAPDDTQNWQAYVAFLKALGATEPTKGGISGPIALSSGLGVKLYALWYQDKPRQAPS
jgi:hypothetical protein